MDDFKVRAETMGQLLAELQDGNAWDSTISLLCDYADLARTLLNDREQTASALAAKDAEIARLTELLVSEREDNLWNAYNTGCERDGRWTHMFMSDGEALAQACGFDPTASDYPADAIKAAIPIAARATGADHD